MKKKWWIRVLYTIGKFFVGAVLGAIAIAFGIQYRRTRGKVTGTPGSSQVPPPPFDEGAVERVEKLRRKLHRWIKEAKRQ